MYFQGDIGFIPLSKLGQDRAAIDTSKPLRTTERRLLIQEGQITGHHHGVWFMPKPVMLHDEALARSFETKAPLKVAATLYEDPAMTAKLERSGIVMPNAPVIGYLVADEDVTIKHASEAGQPTGEHADVRLPNGEYLVVGKREWSAGDERRVQD
jgi:hypothetical protein